MKTTITLLTFLLLRVNSIFAQTSDEDTNDLYPDKYTFEKADEFQKKGEYEKAIWFYINLFPENKTKVVDIVKELAIKLNTIEMDKYIKSSFTLYGTLDPSISSFVNGELKMDVNRLNHKGSWGDQLILEISNSNKALNSAGEYSLRGLEKFKNGDFKGAIEDLNNSINIEPTGQNYFNRAYTKSLNEDFNGSIQDYNKAIELKYNLEEAHFERGYCKQQISLIDEAILDYTKAIQINNEFANALNNRATLLAEKKDYKNAIKDFDKVINLMPEIAQSYVSRGIVKKELGDISGACADWEKAYELGFKQVRELIGENCK
ncbi:MAG: tetratricopeptide repeat protein [Bacteroidales bacterium]|nr:tetratricopeptide repeat protein [Bacteroidales bacterium]